MKYTSIALIIAVIIASANIQKNIFVIANEQQQAEQLGKKTDTHRHKHRDIDTIRRGIK